MLSVAHADDARVVYYGITGDSANALRTRLDADGPLDESGKRFDAHTEWYVTWRYRYRPTASGCEFTRLTVSVTGTIILPRWVHTDRVSDSLVRKWDRYIAALRLHEDGHYAHGVSAAQAIEALEHSLRASGDCAATTDAFNRQAHAILDKYKALDATYDRDTDHGRTQGAQFP